MYINFRTFLSKKSIFCWQIIEFLNNLLEFFENLLEFFFGLSFLGLEFFFEMSKKKPGVANRGEMKMKKNFNEDINSPIPPKYGETLFHAPSDPFLNL